MSFDLELNKNNVIDNIPVGEQSYNALIQLLKKKPD